MSRPSGTTPATPTAPVGPPAAAGVPPSKAHAPTAIVATAPSQTSRTMSRNARPPMVQWTPPSAVGIPPSTMARYPPGYFSIVVVRDRSAAAPAGAMSVWW